MLPKIVLSSALLSALFLALLPAISSNATASITVQPASFSLMPKTEQQLSGPTALTSDTVIEITPPLEVKNTVQYISLDVQDAGQWHKISGLGMLTNAAGQEQKIFVSLETADGQKIALDYVSFGQRLMFSHVNPIAAANEPDLPKTARFTKLHISASPAMNVEGIHWSDISNK